MKKINKTIKYATAYQKWEKSLGVKKHRKYDSSFRFYKDILFELIICQNGLCAYTEYRLISELEVEKIKKEFTLGRYRGNTIDLDFDIEHFDSSLKEHYGWRWSNLFAVYSLINQKVKRREERKLNNIGKKVHHIMKPDLINYSSKQVLKYNASLNIFIPNSSLNKHEKEQVKEMIICLGLNNGLVRMKREEYYNELDVRKSIGEKIKPHQFITGWELR